MKIKYRIELNFPESDSTGAKEIVVFEPVVIIPDDWKDKDARYLAEKIAQSAPFMHYRNVPSEYSYTIIHEKDDKIDIENIRTSVQKDRFMLEVQAIMIEFLREKFRQRKNFFLSLLERPIEIVTKAVDIAKKLGERIVGVTKKILNLEPPAETDHERLERMEKSLQEIKEMLIEQRKILFDRYEGDERNER